MTLAHTAFVAIDVQDDYFDFNRGAKTDNIARKIASFARVMRRTGVPVFAVHFGKSGDMRFHRLKPGKGDITVRKSSCSTFETGQVFARGRLTASFDDALQDRNITHLLVCGGYLEACVRDTVLDALKRGYRVSIIDNLTAPYFIDDHDGNDLEKMLLQQAGVTILHAREIPVAKKSLRR